MDALPNIISKSIVEVLNRLKNDEDNRFSWKLTRNKDSLSLTVSCSLRPKSPNKDKDISEVTGRVTAKPVKRRRKKKKSPSALARSRDRHRHFLEKKLAGKPNLPSPEDKRISTVPTREQDSDNSLCAKNLENTSTKSCGSSGDPVSLENPTPAPASDPDLLNEQSTLLEYLDTQSVDSDGVVSSDSVCADCGRPPKTGQDLIRCPHCHITCYCSIQCQTPDRDFHRFACSVMGKRSGTV